MINTHSAFFMLCILAGSVMLFFCMIRAIRGPRLVDRIMAINMIGTLTIATIAIVSVYLNESSLLDIGLIYVTLSFIAVIVLTEVYIGNYRKRKYYAASNEEDLEREIASLQEGASVKSTGKDTAEREL